MHIAQKKDREQNAQPSFFCKSKSISLKSKLSGTECSQQPPRQSEEQRRKNKKIVTSRKADKLRITAPDSIIITRAIELHLERSHLLGSHTGPGCGYLCKKPDGRTTPSIAPISIHTRRSLGCRHLRYPRPPGDSHHQTQHTQPLGCCASTYCLAFHRQWLKYTTDPQIQMFFCFLK